MESRFYTDLQSLDEYLLSETLEEVIIDLFPGKLGCCITKINVDIYLFLRLWV